MKKGICLWLWATVILFLVSAAARAEEMSCSSPHFTFRVPEGYRSFPDGKKSPETLYCFARGEQGTDQFSLVTITAMGGTIDRKPMTVEDLRPNCPPGAQLTLYDLPWKDYQIQGFRAKVEVQNQKLIVDSAQVPLREGAIQVGVMVHEGTDGAAILKTVLDSLQGESNWLSGSQRSAAWGRLTGNVIFLVLLGCVVAWVLKRKRA